MYMILATCGIAKIIIEAGKQILSSANCASTLIDWRYIQQNLPDYF